MSTAPRTGEPPLASAASWAVLVASFGLSAATWIALARLAGFTDKVTVAGVVTVALAWLMPVAVDGYIVVALVLWMAPVPIKVAAFAKRNTYGAAFVGVTAQSAYHALTVLADTGVVWRGVLAAVVGALPPSAGALAVHMRALIRRESGQQVGGPVEMSGKTAEDLQPPAEPPVMPGSRLVPLPEEKVPALVGANGNGHLPVRPSKPSATRRPTAQRGQAGRKTEIVRKVAAYLAERPDATGKEIADKFGLRLRTAHNYRTEALEAPSTNASDATPGGSAEREEAP